MIKILLICELLALGLCQYTFSDYVEEFNKVYLNEQEYSYRKAVFDENYVSIQQWNSLPNPEYKMKPTPLTDRTASELKSYNRVLIDKNALSNTVTQFNSNLKVNLPSSINWKDLGKLTSAKNQGICGSCWAFASIAVAQSYKAIYDGNLQDLSEQYVLQCTSESNCFGGYTNRALSLIASGGAPTEYSYPYKAVNSRQSPTTNGICEATDKVTMPSGTYLASRSNVSNDDFKALLAVAPVSALFYASDGGFGSYGSGVFSCAHQIYTSDLDHAVQVVGYDTNGNYIIKNSWGRGWGSDGFAVINKDESKNCGISLQVYYYVGANSNNNNNNYSPSPNNNNNNNNPNYSLRIVGLLVVMLVAFLN